MGIDMSARRALLVGLGAFLAVLTVLAVTRQGNSIQDGVGRTNGVVAYLDTAQLSDAPYDVEQAIRTIDRDGGSRSELYQAPDGALLAGLTWSPAGASLAFVQLDSRAGPTHLYVMAASGGDPQEILGCDGTSCITSPAWSPDGSAIAFASGDAVFTVAPDGSSRRQVGRCSACTAIEGGLAWSPDGSTVAFGAWDADYQGAIYLLAVDDGSVEEITLTRCDSALCVGGLRDSGPSWSPDGAWIAFARERNIWLVRRDGNGLAKLTDCPATERYNPCTLGSPIWSPDGAAIAYQGTDGIHLLDADGRNAILLVEGTLLGWQPLRG